MAGLSGKVSACVLALLFSAQAVGAWFSDDWQYRMPITLDSTQVQGVHQGFPVLIDTSNEEPSVRSNLAAGVAQAQGEDVVFTAADGTTTLNHEIEFFDRSAGRLIAWVRVPEIQDDQDTQIFIYYGNANAPDQQRVADVWDTDYRMVQHLNEPGRNGTDLRDSTSRQTDGKVEGTGGNFPEFLTADGFIDGARALPGTPSPGSSPNEAALTFPHTSSLAFGQALTAETWGYVERDQPGLNHNPILWKGSRIGWGANYLFRIAVRSNNQITWGMTCGGREAWFDSPSPAVDQWAHYAITFDGTTIRAFINGQQVATSNGCNGRTLNSTTQPVQSGIALHQNGSNRTRFRGRVDEIRLSSIARPADWLQTQFNTQIMPEAYHQFGFQEEDALSCFADDFEGGVLSGDWVTSVSSGSFTPGIVDGRLRMTEAVSNQSTAATLQREIPGADNLVVLEFDYYAYGGSGADGIAVVLSDAAITPQPGSFGGSLGYAQRNNGDAGFAGGWLGIGIDEFGNFSSPTEGRQGGPGRVTNSVSIRGSGSGTTGYRYLAGTGTLSPGIDATGANSPHRYRITVDSRVSGQAIVSVERNAGGGFNELIAPFNALSGTGQAAVPDNFLFSLTGSTGGSTNIHELDELQLCALKLNPVGAQVDHFEIDHDGVALTCQPETVTIRACADADCNELFTDPVAATLAPEEGWVSGNIVNITGGVGTATLQNTVPDTVTLGVVGSQPSTRPQSQTLCRIGNGPLAPGNCALDFVDSGLSFEVPDLISHRPSGPIQVRAVRRDDQTQACVPAFENVSKTVQFWSTYVSPDEAGRPASRLVEIDEIAIGNNAASPTNLELNFGAGGIAEIDIVYPDAGQMQLNALYSGSEATEDAGLVMPGADGFVSVPAGFCVSAASSCSQGDETCPLFRRAGESFDLTITAAGWQSDTDVDFCAGNPVTPNFELPGIPLQAELVAPAGGETGVVSPGSYDHARAVDAESTVPVDQSEVGVFRFLTSPAPGAYLGRDLPQGRSAPVGRFYPDRFRVTVDPGAFEAECGVGQFTYSGQPFGWLMTATALLEPLSVQGARTRNYTSDGFRRLSVAGVTTLAPTEDAAATDINSDPMVFSVTQEAAALTVQEPGLMLFSFNLNDQFEYPKSPVTRVEPFLPELVFAIPSVQDADGVQAEAAPYEFEPEASFEIRYGRLIMENVYGPETVEALFMPFRVETFEGGRFVTHVADSCSDWTTAGIETAEAHHVLVSDSGTFDEGTAGPLRLEPAGTQGTDLLTWDVPEWLKDDWNNEGVLTDPSATATFGVYRGNDRIIYWREVPAN